jgi:hypothetical protein
MKLMAVHSNWNDFFLANGTFKDDENNGCVCMAE